MIFLGVLYREVCLLSECPLSEVSLRIFGHVTVCMSTKCHMTLLFGSKVKKALDNAEHLSKQLQERYLALTSDPGGGDAMSGKGDQVVPSSPKPPAAGTSQVSLTTPPWRLYLFHTSLSPPRSPSSPPPQLPQPLLVGGPELRDSPLSFPRPPRSCTSC